MENLKNKALRSEYAWVPLRDTSYEQLGKPFYENNYFKICLCLERNFYYGIKNRIEDELRKLYEKP